jgi:O-antigen ligase
MAAFFVSQALMSLSLGLLLMMGVYTLIRGKDNSYITSHRPLVLVLLGLLLLHVFSLLYTTNMEEGWRKLLLKAPFFFLPFMGVVIHRLNSKWQLYILLMFIYMVYFTGTCSTVVYLQYKDFFDPLILQAKPIPIVFGYGVYHIQFSILNAIACLSGLWLWFSKRGILGNGLWVALGCFTLLNVVNLHVLSARTGLMGFYIGVVVMVVREGLKRKTYYSYAIIGLLAMILMPFLAYLVSDSFKNRVINTMEDVDTIIYAKNPNDKSIAMRIEAWKTSLDVIKDAPLTGVGLGDLEEQLMLTYEKRGTLLSPFNRKLPHNQFLETGIHVGLLGMLLLLWLFVVFFIQYKRNSLMLGVVSIWLFSFFFESMLERQVSIAALTFFLPFFSLFLADNKKQGQSIF